MGAGSSLKRIGILNEYVNENGQLYLKLSKHFYHPGDLIEGRIFLNLLQYWNPSEITIEIKGEEFASIPLPSKSQQLVPKQTIPKKIIEKTFLDHKSTIGSLPFLQPGHFEYPFTLQLPQTLGSSLNFEHNDHKALIKYTITGRLVSKNVHIFSLITQRELIITEHSPLTLQQQQQQEEEEEESVSSVKSKKELSLKQQQFVCCGLMRKPELRVNVFVYDRVNIDQQVKLVIQVWEEGCLDRIDGQTAKNAKKERKRNVLDWGSESEEERERQSENEKRRGGNANGNKVESNRSVDKSTNIVYRENPEKDKSKRSSIHPISKRIYKDDYGINVKERNLSNDFATNPEELSEQILFLKAGEKTILNLNQKNGETKQEIQSSIRVGEIYDEEGKTLNNYFNFNKFRVPSFPNTNGEASFQFKYILFAQVLLKRNCFCSKTVSLGEVELDLSAVNINRRRSFLNQPNKWNPVVNDSIHINLQPSLFELDKTFAPLKMSDVS